ncbi:hypothetical protein L950_0204330 [Sphingobacterium sp. IITKGP-BTPF85]|nr:hypothetical protein L950_0204330 [Sphingobacterium sp. IITKGP-BTPF85]
MPKPDQYVFLAGQVLQICFYGRYIFQWTLPVYFFEKVIIEYARIACIFNDLRGMAKVNKFTVFVIG